MIHAIPVKILDKCPQKVKSTHYMNLNTTKPLQSYTCKAKRMMCTTIQWIKQSGQIKTQKEPQDLHSLEAKYKEEYPLSR